MQLDSVQNDLVEVLQYLHCAWALHTARSGVYVKSAISNLDRHDDTEKMWNLLIDFDLEYTDETGKTKLLKRTHPTKEAILGALEEAGETRRSGLVYYGGHGEFRCAGASVLKKSGDRTLYTVAAQKEASGSKNSFLLAIDGGRIYGEDIISRLPEKVPKRCVHTVALGVDMSQFWFNQSGGWTTLPL
ncbi:hypothetical protein FRC01_011761 [Tulasnella sp. 417]|nr:hypothetical protein FRC01_011761 [Tulasnella sp. 417]